MRAARVDIEEHPKRPACFLGVLLAGWLVARQRTGVGVWSLVYMAMREDLAPATRAPRAQIEALDSGGSGGGSCGGSGSFSGSFFLTNAGDKEEWDETLVGQSGGEWVKKQIEHQEDGDATHEYEQRLKSAEAPAPPPPPPTTTTTTTQKCRRVSTAPVAMDPAEHM